MLQVAGRGIGHSLRIANVSLQQEGIHHRAYLSIGVTSSSGVGLCGMSEGVVSWGNGVWLCRISYMNFREFLFHALGGIVQVSGVREDGERRRDVTQALALTVSP